jgi:hypothetical protein
MCVTRPTNAKYQLHMKGVAWQPLQATQQPIHVKHAKYAEIAAINEYETVAFALETYGGLPRESRQLLRTLASYAPVELGGERGFLAHAYRTISCCLQRGNAKIDQNAFRLE